MKRYNFRKIPATDNLFRKVRAENKQTLEEFESFTALQTVKDGKAKNGTSGKAPSYKMYLVRLFIIANERTSMKMNSVEFFNELTFIKKDLQFPEYNVLENRFPSGTINAYLQYWLTKAFEEDDVFDNSMTVKDETLDYISKNEQIIPKEKPGKTNVNGKDVYIRESSMIKFAKEKANWLCEIDQAHNTFISKSNQRPYVEAHHLIPMALQENFEYSLDILPNIISLCPNCHRMFHFGKDINKEKAIKNIYQQRKEELVLAGIGVSYEVLLSFYI